MGGELFLDVLVKADVIPYNNIGSVVWSPTLSLCKWEENVIHLRNSTRSTVLYRSMVTW